MNACPVCGSVDKPKYDGSHWCEPCVLVVLTEQRFLDTPRQDPQIIEAPLRGI